MLLFWEWIKEGFMGISEPCFISSTASILLRKILLYYGFVILLAQYVMLMLLSININKKLA